MHRASGEEFGPSCWLRWESESSSPLVDDLDPVLFDDGVGEDVVGNRFDVLLCLVAGDAVGDGDIEILALTDGGDTMIAESVQRGTDGLTLRIKDRGFQRNEDARFHRGISIMARGVRDKRVGRRNRLPYFTLSGPGAGTRAYRHRRDRESAPDRPRRARAPVRTWVPRR